MHQEAVKEHLHPVSHDLHNKGSAPVAVPSRNASGLLQAAKAEHISSTADLIKSIVHTNGTIIPEKTQIVLPPSPRKELDRPTDSKHTDSQPRQLFHAEATVQKLATVIGESESVPHHGAQHKHSVSSKHGSTFLFRSGSAPMSTPMQVTAAPRTLGFIQVAKTAFTSMVRVLESTVGLTGINKFEKGQIKTLLHPHREQYRQVRLGQINQLVDTTTKNIALPASSAQNMQVGQKHGAIQDRPVYGVTGLSVNGLEIAHRTVGPTSADRSMLPLSLPMYHMNAIARPEERTVLSPEIERTKTSTQLFVISGLTAMAVGAVLLLTSKDNFGGIIASLGAILTLAGACYSWFRRPRTPQFHPISAHS